MYFENAVYVVSMIAGVSSHQSKEEISCLVHLNDDRDSASTAETARRRQENLLNSDDDRSQRRWDQYERRKSGKSDKDSTNKDDAENAGTERWREERGRCVN